VKTTLRNSADSANSISHATPSDSPMHNNANNPSLLSFLKALTSRLDFMRREVDAKRLSAISLRLSMSFLAFLGSMFILSTFLFIVKIPINAASFYIGLILSLGLLLYKNPYKMTSLLIFIGLLGCGFYLSFISLDASWDGRAYHQMGIYFLKNGYNPIYQKMSDVIELAPYLSHQIWIEHYMKFSEVTASCIYAAFNSMEVGKSVNIILAFSVFAYALWTLMNLGFLGSSRARFCFILLCCVLITFNPVVNVQLLTYYVDGLLGSSLTLAFLSIINLESIESKYAKNANAKNNTKIALIKPFNNPHLLIFILSLLFASSIKLTGLGYAGFIGVAYFGYKILFFPFRKSLKIFYSGILLVLLIFACNANPLLTNVFSGKHLGYPLMGKEKIDIITSQQPSNFQGMKRGEKLMHSLFSKTQNYGNNGKSELKFPFIKSKDEHSAQVDMRISGFGAYFSGILILCALLMLFNAKEYKKRTFVALFLLVLGSVLINPEAWWARYVPQMWLVPIVVLVYSFYWLKEFRESVLRIMLIIFLVLSISINLRGNLSYTKEINAFIATLQQDGQYYVYNKHNMELSFCIKLLEKGISCKPIQKEEFERLKEKGHIFSAVPHTLTEMFITSDVKPLDSISGDSSLGMQSEGFAEFMVANKPSLLPSHIFAKPLITTPQNKVSLESAYSFRNTRIVDSSNPSL